jgi:hypothetical protein
VVAEGWILLLDIHPDLNFPNVVPAHLTPYAHLLSGVPVRSEGEQMASIESGPSWSS